ncbi:cAMP-specific 3',5'-cyclic phosphodiesterase 4D [Anguilla anguilla]|uniref:cAMP-specific 3',5'-cyclic phosphodiesterase 4D n=1 Tax=Anguilla anguilla TaxID=7936 RepID=UPI0015ABB4D8|nr:cAMP-specific 3',5'-cyclic phosphodiesterase 4D [Anguilla anguilla]
MKKTSCLAERRRKSVAGVSVDPAEAGVAAGVAVGFGVTESFTVRRLSVRSLQLPPLAFRQAQQAYYDQTPPRPTSLPLWLTPHIAITTADGSDSFVRTSGSEC